MCIYIYIYMSICMYKSTYVCIYIYKYLNMYLLNCIQYYIIV